jgi:hypothetical protein
MCKADGDEKNSAVIRDNDTCEREWNGDNVGQGGLHCDH